MSAADQGVQRRRLPRLHRGHRDDLLGQHVEAVARTLHRLDAAGGHFAGQHRLFEQVAGRLGNEAALALLSDEVAGPADALQRPRHVARRLDLADQIDRPHVDAHFQRRRGDDRREAALLQRLLGFLPHLQGDAAVVGAGKPRRCDALGFLPRSTAP